MVNLSWLEISQKSLLHNLGELRKVVKNEVKILGVVKANAYGHGILEVSRIFQKGGIDWLGVNSLQEGVLLRQNKIKVPTLVLGYIPVKSINQAIKSDLSFAVYNRETVRTAARESLKLKKSGKVHLKIETGTNRQGIKSADVLDFASEVKKYPQIKIEGIYTHFADIEDVGGNGFYQKQLTTFKELIQLLEAKGFKIPLRHATPTAGAILLPESHFDMVRVGIGLYGLWPSEIVRTRAQAQKIKLDLQPALFWKTKVVQIKKVEKGEYIGYGCTFKADGQLRIAVLPVGYFEGYDRKLSNRGRVLVKGQFAPVVGRVCMNMLMVDVSRIPQVELEDEVVLLGKQGREQITAEELAEKVGTINYEIVSRINPLLPRIIV